MDLQGHSFEDTGSSLRLNRESNRMIQDYEDFSLMSLYDQHQLIFACEQLEDHIALQDYDIFDNFIILLGLIHVKINHE